MFWKTKSGYEIKISEMEDSHLINCIRLLEKSAKNGVDVCHRYLCGESDAGTFDVETIYGEEYLRETKYKYLIKEAESRGLMIKKGGN